MFCQSQPSLAFTHVEILTPASPDNLGCRSNAVTQNNTDSSLTFSLRHNNPFPMGMMFPGKLRQQLLRSHFNYEDLLFHSANFQWKAFSVFLIIKGSIHCHKENNTWQRRNRTQEFGLSMWVCYALNELRKPTSIMTTRRPDLILQIQIWLKKIVPCSFSNWRFSHDFFGVDPEWKENEWMRWKYGMKSIFHWASPH